MGYEVVRHEPDEVADVAADLEQIALGAFAANADFGTPEGAQMITRAVVGHARKEGYRCWVARKGEEGLIGFAYGFRSFTGLPPSGWYELLVGALGQEQAAAWVLGEFEIPWMAVRPDHHGRGVGRQLLQALLGSAVQDRAWLVTGADDPSADFYRRLGWKELAIDPLGSDRNRIIFGTTCGASME